ncbi:MAG: hypothetical protein ACPG8W_21355 [Candidatus Promineifilaceae bacterium]
MRLTRFLLLGFGAIILFSSASCSVVGRFRGPQYGSTTRFADTTEVFLVCSDECKARGQCGDSKADDGTDIQVILMSAQFPASRNHDMVVSTNFAGKVTKSQEESMIVGDSDKPFPMNYYVVESLEPRLLSDGTTAFVSGWVQGSCVSNRAAE